MSDLGEVMRDEGRNITLSPGSKVTQVAIHYPTRFWDAVTLGWQLGFGFSAGVLTLAGIVGLVSKALKVLGL